MCGKIILKFILIIHDFIKFRNTKLYRERGVSMPSGKKRKRHKIAVHKRKKKRRANRHKKKLR
jgi:hypothetical protein